MMDGLVRYRLGEEKKYWVVIRVYDGSGEDD